MKTDIPRGFEADDLAMRFAPRLPVIASLVALSCLALALPVDAETVGGGTFSQPAIGPAPSYGIGGPSAVLVKNWNFGANGTIPNYTVMNQEFVYVDQFGKYINGEDNYGACTVAPASVVPVAGQPVEGVNCPPVREFLADSLRTYLVPLNGATTVSPSIHNAGCGSFMADWALPAGGSALGYDIVWETRVRMVTPPYFWFAIWACGKPWDYGAEHDVVESYGADFGTWNNFDGRRWHSNAIIGEDAVPYTNWSGSMSAVGISSFDATQYHTWTWHYKADGTYAMYVDGTKVQWGRNIYHWSKSANPANPPSELYFLFDGAWGHTEIPEVNHSMPASNFAGKYYEWDYSRVYLVPVTSSPQAPTNLTSHGDNNEVTLYWTGGGDAFSYNVYRGTAPGAEGPTPIITNVKTTTFTDTGLTNGTTYYYKVAGVNPNGTSPLSNETSAKAVVSYKVDDTNAVFTGSWEKSTTVNGYYGPEYRHDDNKGAAGGKTAKYTPTLPAPGAYEVFARVPGGPNRSTKAVVTITHAGGSTTPRMNQQVNVNRWVSLGVYNFTPGSGHNATIKNDGSDGYVMADVMEWIPSSTPPAAGTIVDDQSAVRVGSWTYGNTLTGYYGIGYHYAAVGSGSTATFTPSLATPGNYQVYIRAPAASNRATNVAVSVIHNGVTTPLTVNQQQNNNTWLLLGTWYFPAGTTGKVVVRNDGANGYVGIDAVQFTKSP